MRSDNQFSGAFNAAATRKPARKTPPRLTLRFTEDELHQLKSASGNMTLSAYVRKCLFAGGASVRKAASRKPVADQQALARLLGSLGQSGIGQNLARLAQDARSGCLILDEPTEAEIRNACAMVQAMRDDLVAALGLLEKRRS